METARLEKEISRRPAWQADWAKIMKHTDSDRRRRARNGTISSTGKDILAKQMEAIIAREQRDAESHPPNDHDVLRMKFDVGLETPEREKPSVSRNPSRLGSHRRTESHTDLSESESRFFRLKHRPSVEPQSNTKFPPTLSKHRNSY